jgi:hypothetical protein
MIVQGRETVQIHYEYVVLAVDHKRSHAIFFPSVGAIAHRGSEPEHAMGLPIVARFFREKGHMVRPHPRDLLGYI